MNRPRNLAEAVTQQAEALTQLAKAVAALGERVATLERYVLWPQTGLRSPDARER